MTATANLFKNIFGAGPENLTELRAHKDSLFADLEAAQSVLLHAEASYGGAVLNAKSETELKTIETALATKRRDKDRLQAAATAVVARLERAEEREAARTLDEKWEACEHALRARGDALVKLDKIARDYGRAKIAAEDAAREAWRLLPVTSGASEGSSGFQLYADFASLDRNAADLITLYSARDDSPTNSHVWTLSQAPSLFELHQAAADTWLMHRAPNSPLAA